MLVLATKPLQKLTGTGRQAGRQADRQTDGQTCVLGGCASKNVSAKCPPKRMDKAKGMVKPKNYVCELFHKHGVGYPTSRKIIDNCSIEKLKKYWGGGPFTEMFTKIFNSFLILP